MDHNIFVVQESKRPFDYEKTRDCWDLKFFFYKDSVSLYRIYDKWQGWQHRYWPAFLEGTYQQKNNILIVSLKYINEVANTSQSTAHRYILELDTSTKKIKSSKLEFLEDE